MTSSSDVASPEVANIILQRQSEALNDAHTWLQAFLRDKSLSTKLCHDLELITEELLVNSLQHGLESTRGITLKAWIDRNYIYLEFNDHGPPFNPLDSDTPDITADLAVRQAGGLGIHVVKQLADQIEYHYQAEINCLRLRKALE